MIGNRFMCGCYFLFVIWWFWLSCFKSWTQSISFLYIIYIWIWVFFFFLSLMTLWENQWQFSRIYMPSHVFLNWSAKLWHNFPVVKKIFLVWSFNYVNPHFPPCPFTIFFLGILSSVNRVWHLICRFSANTDGSPV